MDQVKQIIKSLAGKVLLLMAIFILIGTFGFYFFESYTLMESLYWTIITITTIGFGDITPTTIPGQMLAIVLAFFGGYELQLKMI